MRPSAYRLAGLLLSEEIPPTLHLDIQPGQPVLIQMSVLCRKCRYVISSQIVVFLAYTKVTPEIEKFIFANRALSGGALKDQISKKFKIAITTRSIERYLAKARAEATANNAAKVEAVRSKILDDADQWANKYLQYLDEEVEALRKLKDSGEIKFKSCGMERTIAIADIKDRIAISQALHKYLITVIEFVKPGNDATLPDEDLDAKLERLITGRKA